MPRCQPCREFRGTSTEEGLRPGARRRAQRGQSLTHTFSPSVSTTSQLKEESGLFVLTDQRTTTDPVNDNDADSHHTRTDGRVGGCISSAICTLQGGLLLLTVQYQWLIPNETEGFENDWQIVTDAIDLHSG